MSTLLILAEEFLGVLEATFTDDRFAVLKKQHFDFGVSLGILHYFLVNFLLLFVTGMLSELLPRVGVLIEMIQLILV